jgi:hypothetical protein
MRVVRSSLVVTMLLGASLVPAVSLAQASPLPAPRDLNVRLTPNAVRAPNAVQAGRHRIQVRAPRGAFATLTLVKPDRGFTRADWRQGRGSIGQRTRFFGGLTLHPGQTGVMWETLYAGRYWLMSETIGRRSRERIQTIRVHGVPSPSRFPRVSAEAFNRDNGARIMSRIPRAGRMLIRNTSPRLDALVLLPLKDGFTYREFLSWVRRGSDGKSPLRMGGFRMTGFTSPSVGYVLRYRLRPGNWVVTDPRTLFGVGRQHHRLKQAFQPLRVHGGPIRANGAARNQADGFTGSPRQRRTVGRALERIAQGRTQPEDRMPWHLQQP